MRVNKINAACAAIMVVVGIGTMGSIVATAIQTNVNNIENAERCKVASELWKESAQKALLGDIYAANDAAMSAESAGCK